MKILRINQSRGQFSIDGTSWTDIDQLDKNAILVIVGLITSTEVEMDAYDEGAIQNKAHKVIYKNLYEKLSLLSQKKTRFSVESEALFHDEFSKYKSMIEDSKLP